MFPFLSTNTGNMMVFYHKTVFLVKYYFSLTVILQEHIHQKPDVYGVKDFI